MKLGMVITQTDPETVFNALRLALYSLEQGDTLLRPVPLYDQALHVAFLTRKLRLLVIETAEIRSLAAGGRVYADPPVFT